MWYYRRFNANENVTILGIYSAWIKLSRIFPIFSTCWIYKFWTIFSNKACFKKTITSWTSPTLSSFKNNPLWIICERSKNWLCCCCFEGDRHILTLIFWSLYCFLIYFIKYSSPAITIARFLLEYGKYLQFKYSIYFNIEY